MGFMALFAMGTGGHYITMMPADWSISTQHIFCPPVSMAKNAMESIYSDAPYDQRRWVISERDKTSDAHDLRTLVWSSCRCSEGGGRPLRHRDIDTVIATCHFVLTQMEVRVSPNFATRLQAGE